MGPLLVTLLLVAAPPPAQYDVSAGAVPVDALCADDKEAQRWALVVLPPPSADLVPVTERLSEKIVMRMERHAGVKSMEAITSTAALAEHPDDEIAQQVGSDSRAKRILVVRLFPDGAGAPPRVLFNVLDETGRSLRSQTARSVIVPRQKSVSAGVERVMHEAEPDEHQSVHDKKLREFHHRALLLDRIKSRETGTMHYVITRDGVELDGDALDALGAPDEDAEATSTFPDVVGCAPCCCGVVFRTFLAPPARHPYVTFVDAHNRRVARELALDTDDVDAKYFPANRSWLEKLLP